jgi:hypothetical protein
MINRDHDLSVLKQCAALGIPAQCLLRASRVSASDLVLMRRLDELHVDSNLSCADAGPVQRLLARVDLQT